MRGRKAPRKDAACVRLRTLEAVALSLFALAIVHDTRRTIFILIRDAIAVLVGVIGVHDSIVVVVIVIRISDSVAIVESWIWTEILAGHR